MNVVYKDLSNKLLTEEQSKKTVHIKEYYVFGAVKKIEECDGSDTTRITYYRDSETNEEIVGQHQFNRKLKAICIREKITYGKYTIENELAYWPNSERSKYELQPFTVKFLYNEKKEEIALEYIDFSVDKTNPENRNLNKVYYFGKSENDIEAHSRPYFASIFDEHGKFQYLYYNPDPSLLDEQDVEEIIASSAETWLRERGIAEETIKWYMNDVFLPPLEN